MHFLTRLARHSYACVGTAPLLKRLLRSVSRRTGSHFLSQSNILVLASSKEDDEESPDAYGEHPGSGFSRSYPPRTVDAEALGSTDQWLRSINAILGEGSFNRCKCGDHVTGLLRQEASW